MILVDTHFHLEEGDDSAAILAAAQAVGVTPLIAVASDLPEALRLQELARREPGLATTVGVHPHVASSFRGDIVPYRDALAAECVKAVGEIGLDYHYVYSPRDIQQDVFARFLRLAAEAGLPAVVHCREAYDDCLAILRDTLVPGQAFVVHSYTGSPEWAAALLDLGAHFSFNGILTFKKAENVRAALRGIPLERLMLETDSPYLAPVPHRGRRNQPAYLADIAAYAAELLGLSLESLARVTTQNAFSFFGLRHQ